MTFLNEVTEGCSTALTGKMIRVRHNNTLELSSAAKQDIWLSGRKFLHEMLGDDCVRTVNTEVF